VCRILSRRELSAYLSDGVDPQELHHSPGWMIGGWFGPILNLWRPLQWVRDLW
jgi:hypothetical protein